jgi:Flavin-binding monooxygenase-like
VLGDPQRIGLPKPDHKLLEAHPIVNSQTLYNVGHGDIMPKLDVAQLCGDSVRFIDGSVEQIDLIIYATGFKTACRLSLRTNSASQRICNGRI